MKQVFNATTIHLKFYCNFFHFVMNQLSFHPKCIRNATKNQLLTIIPIPETPAGLGEALRDTDPRNWTAVFFLSALPYFFLILECISLLLCI